MSDGQNMQTDMVDLLNRDPKGVNSHLLGVAFDEVLAEPDAAHSMDCVWSNSYKCFECGKGLCYKLLTCLCGLCIALCWGCTFGCIAFEHVWCITPEFRVLDINCNICQRLYGLCVHCMCDPCCDAFAILFKFFGKGGDAN